MCMRFTRCCVALLVIVAVLTESLSAFVALITEAVAVVSAATVVASAALPAVSART
jgi:hypothetical protein